MEDLYEVISSSTNENSSNASATEEMHHHSSPQLPLAVDHRMKMLQVDPPNVMPDPIKTQIANHPRYPSLLAAYIQCRQVGASPELASLLEDIPQEFYSVHGSGAVGADPELDEFMESYCNILHRYKEELSRPFREATSFLSSIQSELSALCPATMTAPGDCPSDEAAGTSDEEQICGEAEAPGSQECSSPCPGDLDLKEVLMRKYSGYLSNLRNDFLKKRKKSKLPKDARTVLLDWWNAHNKWPYPTEEEKMKLSDATGLDAKQINNWFINQRKRHWKPSKQTTASIVGGAGGSIAEPINFDATGGDL